jgi:surfeit locus 1 family protein
MRPLSLTRAGVLGTLGVFCAAALCIRLGFWQLDRRHQRLDRNAVIEARMGSEPVALRGAPDDTAGLAYRRASAHGPFDNNRSIILAGRSYNGAPGVYLFTPLRLDDGAVLVLRGWLPAPDAATVDLVPVVRDGDLDVAGILMPFPVAEHDDAGGASFRQTWFRFDGDAIRAQFPYPVAPVYLQATSRPNHAMSSDTARDFPVVLAPPALDQGPHLSYAIQWFSFATIFVIGWAVLLARRGDARTGDAGVDRDR